MANLRSKRPYDGADEKQDCGKNHEGREDFHAEQKMFSFHMVMICVTL